MKGISNSASETSVPNHRDARHYDPLDEFSTIIHVLDRMKR